MKDKNMETAFEPANAGIKESVIRARREARALQPGLGGSQVDGSPQIRKIKPGSL